MEGPHQGPQEANMVLVPTGYDPLDAELGLVKVIDLYPQTWKRAWGGSGRGWESHGAKKYAIHPRDEGPRYYLVLDGFGQDIYGSPQDIIDACLKRHGIALLVHP